MAPRVFLDRENVYTDYLKSHISLYFHFFSENDISKISIFSMNDAKSSYSKRQRPILVMTPLSSSLRCLFVAVHRSFCWNSGLETMPILEKM